MTAPDDQRGEVREEPPGELPGEVPEAPPGGLAGAHRDELPEDLDRGFVGPYTFPGNERRRIQGAIHIVAGLLGIVVVLVAGPDAVLVNTGVAIAGAALVLIGVYHLVAGVRLAVDENDALLAATRGVGFPVGHASAQLGWRGLRSRPTWRVLVYSAENPPTHRGLVLVDGVDAHVVDRLIELNPEDWSDGVPPDPPDPPEGAAS
jgi:hypothetical protein